MPRVLLALLCSAVLAACTAPAAPTQPTSAAPTAEPAAAPTAEPAAPSVALPAPSAGLAVVGGRILSKVDNSPLFFVRVAFAEVLRSGEEAVYFDDPVDTPAVEADAQGFFVISDIPPGEYVIVVGDPMGSNVLVTEADGTTPLFVTLTAGEQRDFGTLMIDLAP